MSVDEVVFVAPAATALLLVPQLLFCGSCGMVLPPETGG